jgi:antirestriction protein ArdC
VSASAEKRAERREADRERMTDALDTLCSSEGWKRWLAVRARFRTYSLHNQILIAHQCPQASRVAGFKRWLELGRVVRKGERGIRIWAPCPPSKKRIEQWRRAGSKPEEEPKTYFRMVPVFDLSQVEEQENSGGRPAPLGPPHSPLDGDGLSGLIEPLSALANSIGCAVSLEPIEGPPEGYYEPASKRIVIDAGPGRSPDSQAQTLIHELGHALIRVEPRETDPTLTYAEEEVVVEALAYTVCSALGVDAGSASVPYMACWGESDEGVGIERYAGLIDRLASRIEVAVIDEKAPGPVPLPADPRTP